MQTVRVTMRRVEEFLGMAIIGMIAGIATFTLPFVRATAIPPFAYVIIFSVLVGMYSIILLAPHPSVVFLSPLGLWLGIGLQRSHPRGALALVALSLMMWTIGELVRHRVRLRLDQEYRKRWDRRHS
jgi:hypothetical protein